MFFGIETGFHFIAELSAIKIVELLEIRNTFLARQEPLHDSITRKFHLLQEKEHAA